MGGIVYRRPMGAVQPFPPEYEGDIFYADFYGFWLRRLKRTGGTWSPEPAPGQPNAADWGNGADYVSEWLEAPDGTLWYVRLLTSSGSFPGEIRRIRYTGTVSVPPSVARSVELRPPYPSPSRAEVSLEFVLAGEAEVSLAIHDIGGRRVRALADAETRSAGPHRVVWDGRDDRGRRSPPGVYHVRLLAAGHEVRRRLVLVD